MKEKFYGFYTPEENEIKTIWEDSILSFDANSLLNIYRYSKNTKNNLINILEEYSDRLWLTYQAAYEFHKNRITVIKSQEAAYAKLCTELDTSLEKLFNCTNSFKRHPFINIPKLNDDIQKKINTIKKNILKQKESHPNYLKQDSTLIKITAIFKNKIGNDFSELDLEKLYEEGKVRYNSKMPPGYADLSEKKGKGNKSLYGDFIIWKQLIKKSKESKKNIIFVTDERKDDWWHKHKGETIRPREELIKEFYDETGIRILIYHTDTFLKIAKDRLNADIKEATLNEVKEIRLEDDKIDHKLKIDSEKELLNDDIFKIYDLNNRYPSNLFGWLQDSNRMTKSEKRNIKNQRWLNYFTQSPNINHIIFPEAKEDKSNSNTEDKKHNIDDD